MIIGIEREAEDGTDGDARLAKSYKHLQLVVGVIAASLPFVVGLGDQLLGDVSGFRGSISAYYYGRTGNYFVGALCALGVFFVSYEYAPDKDHEVDNVQSFFTGLLAIGVALFPTSSGEAQAFTGEWWVKAVHLACAGLLFLSLAVFSLYHFTKTHNEVTDETTWQQKLRRVFRSDPSLVLLHRKRKRNAVYRICGWIIVLCLVAIVATSLAGLNYVFWLESIAVIAFGTSWLTKSGTLPIYRDVVNNVAPPGKSINR